MCLFVRITKPEAPPNTPAASKKKKTKKSAKKGGSNVFDAFTEKQPEAPPNTPAASKKKKTKKSAKKGGSNVFDAFTEKQIREFKEGFQFMDKDKDGVIGENDIKAVCNEIGKMTNDAEVDSMLKDSDYPINFTVLLNMFSSRQQGSAADEDDVVIKAFKAFEDDNGMIDSESFGSLMMQFGEKYTKKEIDDFYSQVEMDEKSKFSCQLCINMLTGKGEEEEQPPVEA